MARRNFERTTSAIPVVIDFQTGKAIEKPGIPVICSQIHLFREKNGMEQKALGQAIGVSSNAISNWENGRSRPDVNLLPAICGALHISLNDLFAIPASEAKSSERDQQLLARFHRLNTGHKIALENMADSLLYAQKVENHREIRQLRFMDRPLAAGIGDPTEFEEESEPIYVYTSDDADRADYVFKVNGDSMSPDYKDGDLVFVQSLPIGFRMNYGEIGAFIVGNEMYIKEYREDGLHSVNPKYPVLRFSEEESVYLIGRVLSVMDKAEIASREDVHNYLAQQAEK